MQSIRKRNRCHIPSVQNDKLSLSDKGLSSIRGHIGRALAPCTLSYTARHCTPLYSCREPADLRFVNEKQSFNKREENTKSIPAYSLQLRLTDSLVGLRRAHARSRRGSPPPQLHSYLFLSTLRLFLFTYFSSSAECARSIRK
ncbi:unnamed protein product [Nezara viridula]|uniref:Uncharacterized protein n=1 Tax=Nezara viridula TaxID=85310 RepID=A0A9P0HEM1_NEZVI|nr:unnamed protein product [Nezara viridula]